MRTAIALFAVLAATRLSADVTDTYGMTLTLQVPQVFDNYESLGYRKYQTQKVTGDVYVNYGDDGRVTFSFSTLTNHQFKLHGAYVTYEALPDDMPNWVYVGNNRTGRFVTPCVKFDLECLPNYAEGMTDDSALVLTCAGKGVSNEAWKGHRVPRTVTGYCAGTLGCGCASFGHVSPTRLVWSCGPLLSAVSDIAPVYGKFTMKLRKSERKCD